MKFGLLMKKEVTTQCVRSSAVACSIAMGMAACSIETDGCSTAIAVYWIVISALSLVREEDQPRTDGEVCQSLNIATLSRLTAPQRSTAICPQLHYASISKGCNDELVT
jgi:hypothetical protein